MSIDPSKLPDSSIRLNIPVGTPFGATEANAASAQIQQLKLENEQLRRDKFEIEQKLQEEIRIIKANLRDEKEQREEIQDKIKKAEESARNKKKERMKLIDELQIEKDDKNRSVKREKEIEEQLIQKEKEKRKVEQELRYEREEKKESQINLEELEKKNKIEVEKRRKAEDEKERISFENNNLRIENERLKKQLGQETNHVSENETKYLIEAEENKRIKKETEERIKVEIDIDGKQKKLIKRGKNEIANTVSLSEVLEYGIWELEVQFSNNGQCGAIGIVDNSYNIPAQADPDHSPHVNHMAIYAGAGWNSGKVQCKGSNTSGNKSFEDNQIIKAEYDSEKGTLIWFVDGVQQPVYITGIRERVKFMISLYNAGSICTIRSLKKLANPTCKHLGNENTVHW
ncbi:MAG: hypothetical protein EZS28_020994 [Streblomastix strix]|uniref:SPRY domain-containing protein n=1 Tax=Streblomastix strix TaxID=222440 RepID=A0A5J4VLT6_9EUKA|nr:MAG: hypothetical protein EZS28_020994 [Streblomastix strix]